MRSKDVDELAKKKEPLPADALLADFMLYQALRSIYERYDAKTLDVNGAFIAKRRVMEKHGEAELWERIHKDFMKRQLEAEVTAREAFTEHKCPLCVKMYDLICGIKSEKET